LDDFLSVRILIEKKFRTKIDEVNWEKYENTNVL